jgi:hypothetical protein
MFKFKFERLLPEIVRHFGFSVTIINPNLHVAVKENSHASYQPSTNVVEIQFRRHQLILISCF